MWKKAVGNITIRTGPGSTYPNATLNGVAQYVLTGDVLEVSEIQNGFAHILRIIRNGAQIVIPDVSWCGTAYLTDTVAPPIAVSRQVTVTVEEVGWQTVSATVTQNKEG